MCGRLLNDGTADSKGGIYFTKSGVHYADAKGNVTKYGTVGGNGIILSADEKTLYVTGTHPAWRTWTPRQLQRLLPCGRQRDVEAERGGDGLVAYDVQPDGSLKNERQFSTCACGDGSTIDSMGRIYSTGGMASRCSTRTASSLGKSRHPFL